MADPSSLADARAAAAALGTSALLRPEPVDLAACPGRIAAEDVVAGFALPGFDSSAMDGWAVRAADVERAGDDAPVTLGTVGESRAGHPAAEVVGPGTAARISTGARLPPGADAVVRVEDVEVTDDGIVVRAPVARGRDVRRAGEDIATGDVAVRAGERLRPGHVALLAGLGVDRVACRRRPRVLIVVTGDELRPVEDAAAHDDLRPAGDAAGGALSDAGTIVFGTHRPSSSAAGIARAGAGRILDVGGPALAALLGALGAEVAGIRHAGDTLDETVAALDPSGADLLVSTGGVSVGPHDHVRGALARRGAVAAVSALDLQPGRPTWMGSLTAAGPGPGEPGAAVASPAVAPPAVAASPTAAPSAVVPVLALPGNPGAAITVATLLLTPLLRGMSGRPVAAPVHARLAADERAGRRVRALRVALGEDDAGRRIARVLDGQQAHRLASFPATQAFALILAGDRPLEAGTRVEVVPMPGAA